MNVWRNLKLGFLVLFLSLPIRAMNEQEENYGVNFNKLSPEIREKILSKAPLSTYLTLSQTSKDWYNTIAPFFLPSPQVIDFSRHFAEKTIFKFAFSQSFCLVLAQEYGKSDKENEGMSNLTIVKIDPRDLHETIIDLKVQLKWIERPTPQSWVSPSDLVCLSSCPHGGVFVYISETNNPISDARKKIIFINDLGVNSQDIWDQYKNCDYADLICGKKYIALIPKYDDPSPILFIPYMVNSNAAIQYTPETFMNQWPRLQKKSWGNYEVRPLEDKFRIIVGDDCYMEDDFIIDPKNTTSPLPHLLHEDPAIQDLVKETVFPHGYKLLNSCLGLGCIKANNLLFILGRKETLPPRHIIVKNMNRNETPYPYGLIIVKNLKNSETIARQFLFDNTQLENIEWDVLHISGSYLFVKTTYSTFSTPKLIAINIQHIQRLFSEN